MTKLIQYCLRGINPHRGGIVYRLTAGASSGRAVRVLLVLAVTALGAGGLCAQASADTGMTTVRATVTPISGGGSSSTYALPGGQTMVIDTPPTSFSPASASSAALQKYGFPARPASGSARTDWQNAMNAYNPETAPPTTITVPTSTTKDESTFASNWAGFTAGQWNSQSQAFISVKADVTVPTVNGCFGSGQDVFAWIGLGGTNASNDLLQQGVECNDYGSGTNLPDTGALHAFREFANTRYPQDLCGTAENLYGGETMYENLNYETSDNTANFYMENTGTGNVIGSCSVTSPSGWTFDGNTADYEVEVAGPQAPLEFAVSTVTFSDAQLQWGSSGDWVTFGSRPTTKTFDGVSLSNYCEGPSTISSNNELFSVSDSGGDCAADN